MKLHLILAQQINTPTGPGRQTVTYDDVRGYELIEGGKIVRIDLESGATALVNLALVLSLNVDPFGNIVHGGAVAGALSP